MDVHYLTSILISILLDVAVQSGRAVEYSRQSPLSTFDTRGHVDKSVTLRCHFLTSRHNRGWLMIKWYRMEPDGSALPLTQLSARGKVPEWSANIPATLQSRLQPIITLQPGHVEFNLIINNLTCTDEGDYRCTAITPDGEVISTAELQIYGGTQTPRILYELWPTSQPPAHIEAVCRADVGFPPQMLVWYIRRPNDTYFTIIDEQPDVVQESDGCHTFSSRKFDVNIFSEPRGTYFRCGYPGYIEKDGLYDEFILDFSTAGVEEVRANRKMSTSCDDELCDTPDKGQDRASLISSLMDTTSIPEPGCLGDQETEVCCVVVKLIILPSGLTKQNVMFHADKLLSEEKNRLLAEDSITSPDEYRMLLRDPNGAEVQLEDSQRVKEVINLLAQGRDWEIRFHHVTAGS